MLPVGFEPAIPGIEWPQTYVLDRAATGIGSSCNYVCEQNTFAPNLTLLNITFLGKCIRWPQETLTRRGK